MKTKKHRRNVPNPAARGFVSPYEPSFKKAVILYAEQKSNSAARKRFGVSETNIKRWRKLKTQILEKAQQSVRRSKRNTSYSSTHSNGSQEAVESPREDITGTDNPNNDLDSMPLQQRLSQNVAQTAVQNVLEPQSHLSVQEPVLQSQPISPTKLKVTRQGAKPQQAPAKAPTPPPPVEKVCLKWDSHHTNMQAAFPNLLLREQYVDATLVSEGKTLKCHKMILSSCSPYFEEVLNDISPFQHPVLFMKDIPFWILKALCDFMYAGEVHIMQNKLGELLAVADNLKIKGLTGTQSPKEDTNPIVIPEIKQEMDVSPPQFSKKEPEKLQKEPERLLREDIKHEFKHDVKSTKKREDKKSKHQSHIPKEKEREREKERIVDELPPKLMPKLSPKLPTKVVQKVVIPKVHTQKAAVKNISKPSTSRNTRDTSRKNEKHKVDSNLLKEKEKEKEKPILKKNEHIIDPLDLLEPVYEEIAKEEPPVLPKVTSKSLGPAKLKDNRNASFKKGLKKIKEDTARKKVKKRRYAEYAEDREESPSPTFQSSRKGTRSRPNVKIPKYFHTHYEDSPKETSDATIVRVPHTDQNDPLIGTDMEVIKAEPLDVEENTIDVEENLVNFIAQDQEIASQEDEEIIGSYDSPIVNIKREGKINTPNIFKKIIEPVIMDVHTVTEAEQSGVRLLNINEQNVKIVDISKIGSQTNQLQGIIEERSNYDPLDSQDKTSSIKISNVQSIAETSTLPNIKSELFEETDFISGNNEDSTIGVVTLPKERELASQGDENLTIKSENLLTSVESFSERQSSKLCEIKEDPDVITGETLVIPTNLVTVEALRSSGNILKATEVEGILHNIPGRESPEPMETDQTELTIKIESVVSESYDNVEQTVETNVEETEYSAGSLGSLTTGLDSLTVKSQSLDANIIINAYVKHEEDCGTYQISEDADHQPKLNTPEAQKSNSPMNSRLQVDQMSNCYKEDISPGLKQHIDDDSNNHTENTQQSFKLRLMDAKSKIPTEETADETDFHRNDQLEIIPENKDKTEVLIVHGAASEHCDESTNILENNKLYEDELNIEKLTLDSSQNTQEMLSEEPVVQEVSSMNCRNEGDEDHKTICDKNVSEKEHVQNENDLRIANLDEENEIGSVEVMSVGTGSQETFHKFTDESQEIGADLQNESLDNQLSSENNVLVVTPKQEISEDFKEQFVEDFSCSQNLQKNNVENKEMMAVDDDSEKIQNIHQEVAEEPKSMVDCIEHTKNDESSNNIHGVHENIENSKEEHISEHITSDRNLLNKATTDNIEAELEQCLASTSGLASEKTIQGFSSKGRTLPLQFDDEDFTKDIEFDNFVGRNRPANVLGDDFGTEFEMNMMDSGIEHDSEGIGEKTTIGNNEAVDKTETNDELECNVTPDPSDNTTVSSNIVQNNDLQENSPTFITHKESSSQFIEQDVEKDALHANIVPTSIYQNIAENQNKSLYVEDTQNQIQDEVSHSNAIIVQEEPQTAVNQDSVENLAIEPDPVDKQCLQTNNLPKMSDDSQEESQDLSEKDTTQSAELNLPNDAEDDEKKLEESLLEMDDDIIMKDATIDQPTDDSSEKTLEMIVNDLNESLGSSEK